MLQKKLYNHPQKEDAISRGSEYQLEYPLISALDQQFLGDKIALQNTRERDRVIWGHPA
jgi:hypothetical protein